MSAAINKSLAMRVVKFLLGTDQRSFVVAAAAVPIAWGILVAFYIVYSGARPTPPLWETIGLGLALGLFILPFLFISIERLATFIGHWEALATLTAASVSPLLLRLMGEQGLDRPVYVICSVGVLAFVGGSGLLARMAAKRYRRRTTQSARDGKRTS